MEASFGTALYLNCKYVNVFLDHPLLHHPNTAHVCTERKSRSLVFASYCESVRRSKRFLCFQYRPKKGGKMGENVISSLLSTVRASSLLTSDPTILTATLLFCCESRPSNEAVASFQL